MISDVVSMPTGFPKKMTWYQKSWLFVWVIFSYCVAIIFSAITSDSVFICWYCRVNIEYMLPHLFHYSDIVDNGVNILQTWRLSAGAQSLCIIH